MKELKEKILETVNKDNLKMIPKWKFVLYSSLVAVFIVFTSLIMLFVFSLIFFVLSRYGFLDMPFFGFMYVLHTLKAVPSLLLLCTAVLLLIIEAITRYYSFSFRRPIALTLLFITSVAVLTSYVISQTSMHEYIREYAKINQFDVLSKAYGRPTPFKNMSGMDIIRGEVISITPTSTNIELFDGTTILAYSSTTGEKSSFLPVIGDDIVILGNIIDGHFEISNIRPAMHMPLMPHIQHIKHREGFENSKNLINGNKTFVK